MLYIGRLNILFWKRKHVYTDCVEDNKRDDRATFTRLQSCARCVQVWERKARSRRTLCQGLLIRRFMTIC